jgi:hypothetical protein
MTLIKNPSGHPCPAADAWVMLGVTKPSRRR